MKVYAVVEHNERYGDNYIMYYIKKEDACAHVKALRTNMMLYTNERTDKYRVVTVNVLDKFIPGNVSYAGFKPTYVEIVTNVLSDSTFIGGIHDESYMKNINPDSVIILIDSEYQMYNRRWAIRPWIKFYIPYSRIPYSYMVAKANKLGARMLQRVKSLICFQDMYGFNPMMLYRLGWHFTKADSEARWQLIMRRVEEYWKTDTSENKPDFDQISVNYMYKCCPGAFNGNGPCDAITWKDTLYKTLDEVKAYGHL